MRLNQLKKAFEFISISLDNDYDNGVYRYVNCGGCGYVALRLYDILSKHYPCKIRMFDYSPLRGVQHNGKTFRSLTSFINNVAPNNLQDMNRKGIECVHVVVQVQIDGREFLADSTGLHTVEHMKLKMIGYHLLTGHIPRKHMQTLWDSEKGWNTTFDREETIPVIDESIERNLAELIA
jgi:hypothetical protein